MIRFGKIATSVVGTSKCASACFIAFAAGSEKYVNYTASSGSMAHQMNPAKKQRSSGAATVTVARMITQELGVPPSIIGKMVITPPEQMVWHTPDDLRSMGTTMTGKPSQVSTELPSSSDLSSQLRPQEKSTAKENASPPSWDMLLDRAIELSEQQNGGKPDIQRICQPELKKCINGLAFKTKDGDDMIMKVTEDMDGKMLKREVCSFNTHGDIRTCLNWETGGTERDIRNSRT